MSESANDPIMGVTWLKRDGGPLAAVRRSFGVTWIVILAMFAAVLSPAVGATTDGDSAGDENASLVTFSSKYDNDDRDGSDDRDDDDRNDRNDRTEQPLSQVRKDIGIVKLERKGVFGQGIDIALIDTGVASVPGLNAPGKVLHGPDLSGEGGTADANVDTYGHGTHIAGILAGTDGAGGEFQGMAVASRIISLKVAGADGVTSEAQVVAAIDWVVEHRDSDGLNIRVLNLSFGLDGVQSNANDPMSAAVERAWDAGIVVVAAAGNRGNDRFNLDSPAISPYVIAIGATNTNDARRSRVTGWSSSGNGLRDPDAVAAGQSLLSLRVPGSTIDRANPKASVDERFFKGSGTSQASAVVSGAIASLISADPGLTNDQVKYLVMQTAKDKNKGTVLDGEGLVRIHKAYRKLNKKTLAAEQDSPRASTGNPDGLTAPDLSGATWSGGTWSGTTWSGGTWSGATWSGTTWSGTTWSGATWSGTTWSGTTWSGTTWSAGLWS